jgi:hypothetical protein
MCVSSVPIKGRPVSGRLHEIQWATLRQWHLDAGSLGPTRTHASPYHLPHTDTVWQSNKVRKHKEKEKKERA